MLMICAFPEHSLIIIMLQIQLLQILNHTHAEVTSKQKSVRLQHNFMQTTMFTLADEL